MYRFSRSIYREIAPRVVEDERDATGCRNRQSVLEACEGTLRRLATDRRYFARPARSLFNDVRMHFAISDQQRVWLVIESNISLAMEMLDFCSAIRLGAEPRSSAALGLDIVRMVEAVDRSLASRGVPDSVSS